MDSATSDVMSFTNAASQRKRLKTCSTQNISLYFPKQRQLKANLESFSCGRKFLPLQGTRNRPLDPTVPVGGTLDAVRGKVMNELF